MLTRVEQVGDLTQGPSGPRVRQRHPGGFVKHQGLLPHPHRSALQTDNVRFSQAQSTVHLKDGSRLIIRERTFKAKLLTEQQQLRDNQWGSPGENGRFAGNTAHNCQM